MSKIELISPAGDFECIKAAVQNGADSIYFGGCGCDSEILFFIIIFLLLFTNFGCGCQR